MAVDVLNILRFAAVDVSRQIQVVVVLGIFDFGDGDHAGVTRIGFVATIEGVDDAMNVLLTQPVFVAVFDKALGGVDHKDALSGGRVFFVQHQNTSRDAGAVEQVGGQANNSFEETRFNQFLADDRFGIAAKQDAVRKDACAFAFLFHAANDVE